MSDPAGIQPIARIGIGHLLLTWLLCMPPLGLWVLDVLVKTRAEAVGRVLDPTLSRIWFVFIGLRAHWFFVTAAAISATILALRAVVNQSKWRAWFRVALAAAASLFIQLTQPGDGQDGGLSLSSYQTELLISDWNDRR